MQKTVLGVILAFLVLVPGMPFSETSDRRQFEVAKRAKLALTIPSSMIVESQERQDCVLTLTIIPAEGDVFTILISAVKVRNGGDPKMSPEMFEYLVRLRGTQLLDTAVEPELKITESTGDHGIGYLYTLTDKREELPPGEKKYLCQGIVMLDKINLSATLLADSLDEAVVAPFIEILRSAESL